MRWMIASVMPHHPIPYGARTVRRRVHSGVNDGGGHARVFLPMIPDPPPTPVCSGPAVAMPPLLAAWLAPFRDGFTAAVWPRVLVLVAGAVLAPRQRTVSAALRVMGLADRPGFGRYHEVLSEARWHASCCCTCSTRCCPKA